MKGEKETPVMTPDEYLSWASGNTPPPIADSASLPIVEGDVDLFSHPFRDMVSDLPPAEIRGDLKANSCTKLKSIDCKVSGNVVLKGSSVAELGSTFSCGGYLNASLCQNLVSVSGRFPREVDLRESGVVSLDSDFQCGGDLSVSKCRNLQSLDCRVGGTLHAVESSLLSLGKNFSCPGDLMLHGCSRLNRMSALKETPRDVFLSGSGIREIDRSFCCSGALLLRNVEHLEKLSGCFGNLVEVEGAPSLRSAENIVSAGKLTLSHCPSLSSVQFKVSSSAELHLCGMQEIAAASVAKELTVRRCENLLRLSGRWPGDVTLTDLRAFRETRPDFHCSGHLMIRSCPDFSDLAGSVGESLTMSQVPSLREIPASVRVGGKLVLACPESRLRSIGCRVGGDLVVMGCSAEFSTSTSMDIGGSAIFSFAKGLKHVRGRVAGNMSLDSASGVEDLGADLEIGGDLHVKGCHSLKTLNCWVGGGVKLEDSSLTKTSPAFFCGADLILSDVAGLKGLQGKISGECRVLPEGTQGSQCLSNMVTKRRKYANPAAHVFPNRPQPMSGGTPRSTGSIGSLGVSSIIAAPLHEKSTHHR